MKNSFGIRLLVFILVIPVFSAWIDPFRDEVSRGNSNYNSGNFSKAISNYKEAEKYAPDSEKKSMLEFNRGNVEFRQNNYESAIARYRNSLNSGDRDVQKKALFNEGTAYMKMGKKKEAAESFIKALQIDPSYEKAKRNLEYLMKKNEQDKKDNSKKQGDGEKEQQKSSASGSDRDRKDKGDEKNSSVRARNMLESMKNKPVRRRKGKGDGEKYLEKYW